MCKDQKENKINKVKFYEEIDQFNEQFKVQIIGQHFYFEVVLISKLRIMVSTLHFVILS